MEKDILDRIEELFEKPYFVIDFLPEQVKPGGGGQFFEIEQYYLKHPEKKHLFQKFVDIVLKLNCCYDFQVDFHEETHLLKNPAPDTMARWILQCSSNDSNYMNILIEEENAMLVISGAELCIAVYNSSDRLKWMLQVLAAAEGLFVWQPDNS